MSKSGKLLYGVGCNDGKYPTLDNGKEAKEKIIKQQAEKYKDSIDTHEDAVRYAKETGAEIKQMEGD